MPQPMMSELQTSNLFLGAAEVVEERIMPLPDQLEFGVGDTAILAQANTALEEVFTVVRAVDPLKHAETFPDWEERMQLRSFVLCEIFTQNDPVITLGWINRTKLYPIPKYRYYQIRGWRKNGYPDKIPSWVPALALKYSDQLSQRAPDVVPRGAQCPACKERHAHMVITRTVSYDAHAGVLVRHGAEVYVPISDVKDTDRHNARLICRDCGHHVVLEDEQWRLPGIVQEA